MIFNRYILFFSFLFWGTTVFGQKIAGGSYRFGEGEDSIQCIDNLNLFLPYAKVGEFLEAAPYWERAYATCPASSKNLYIYGPSIIKAQIGAETDSVKIRALIEKLMKVYDDRMRYFGDDEKYPSARILGNKALDYEALMGEKADRFRLFSWYKTAVDGMKGDADVRLYVPFLQLSQRLFRQGKLSKSEFLQIYHRVSEYVEVASISTQGETADYLKQVRLALPQFLAVSGAADCETLQELYGPQLEANKNNVVFLKQAISAFRKAECTESELYFTISEYIHRISPTFESAMGLAAQAYQKGENDRAVTFFKEAETLAEHPSDRTDVQYNIAVILASRQEYVASRAYARKAVASQSKHGKALLLIARLYASVSSAIYPEDPILSRCVYYAVLDKLEEARSADPMLDGEVLELISSYRRLLPSAEDIFMHPALEKGKTITIGGWIQEKTVVR